MIKRFPNILPGLIILLLLLQGCAALFPPEAKESEVAPMYNPSEYSLNIDYKIYHISDMLTSLYIRIFPGELLFNSANSEAELRANVRIRYQIYELDEEDKVLAKVDSSEFLVKIGGEAQNQTAYFANKTLRVPAGKKYLVRLDSKDVLRGTIGLRHLYIDKSDVYGSQNFSVLSPVTNYPKFLNYFAQGEVFRLDYRLPGIDTIYVDYYKPDHSIPRPQVVLDGPSFFTRIPDTTMIMSFADTLIYTLPFTGMYHFRIDTLHHGGITLHNYGTSYPQVKTDTDLMEPLFYIATMAEYRSLQRSHNVKRAVDDFWLERTSSMDRSRELIRVYYNRVLYSNLYFIADREGWKTDQGMIYILFGPPDRIRDTGNEQQWYYISRKQQKIIRFTFQRKPGQFSNQELEWKKTTETLQYWSAAVSSWRSGKVYTFNK